MDKITKYLVTTIFLLLTIPSVYSSYAVSSPGKTTLEPGSSKEFDFQIQAYTSDQDLECSYSIGNTTPFEIEFFEAGLDVQKRSFSMVKGSVNAPKKASEGNYSYDFCISCTPKSTSGGASTSIRFCGLKLNIELVSPPKDVLSQKRIKNLTLLGIPLLLVLILIFIIIIRKRKNVQY